MILSQNRATGYWTEFRTEMRTRYEPRGSARLIGRLYNVHDPASCEGRGCAIHNHPSDHPLKGAPLNWRTDRGILERICEHGVGHDDHDAVEFQMSKTEANIRNYIGTHGCDGCCSGRRYE